MKIKGIERVEGDHIKIDGVSYNLAPFVRITVEEELDDAGAETQLTGGGTRKTHCHIPEG